MKATHTKTPPTFTPVTINITCETQEELDALTCISDTAGICEAAQGQFNLAHNWVEPLNEALRAAGGSEHKFNAFLNRLRGKF